jgi:hypothetical protein
MDCYHLGRGHCLVRCGVCQDYYRGGDMADKELTVAEQRRIMAKVIRDRKEDNDPDDDRD